MNHVRPATEYDVLAILSLSNEYKSLENHHKNFPLDIPYFAANILTIIKHPGYLLNVATDDGVVVGFIMAMTSAYLWSRQLMTVDNLLFVRPGSRSSSSAIKLIRSYEEWARSVGATDAMISIASGINEEKVSRFYSMLGYKHIGLIHKKEL